MWTTANAFAVAQVSPNPDRQICRWSGATVSHLTEAMSETSRGQGRFATTGFEENCRRMAEWRIPPSDVRVDHSRPAFRRLDRNLCPLLWPGTAGLASRATSLLGRDASLAALNCLHVDQLSIHASLASKSNWGVTARRADDAIRRLGVGAFDEHS